MSDETRRCPNCGHALLGITTSDEIASCPNCGKFYERYRPGPSRWPAFWIMALALCGPMVLMALMQVGRWAAQRGQHQALVRFLVEATNVGIPLAWFGWPLVAAFLLARRYAPAPERWMSWLGLVVAGLVGNTAVMLASMLMRLLF